MGEILSLLTPLSATMSRSDAVVRYLQPVRAFEEGETDPFAGKIRVTPDGKISVLDVIATVTFMNPDGSLMDKASARASEYFSRLRKTHNEVTTICGHFRFPGQGQRDTPVADRFGIINIIQLLPGRKADAFRRSLGTLAIKYLDADEDFVRSVLERYRERTGEEFPAATREELLQQPRIQATVSNKEDMQVIKESAPPDTKVSPKVYAIVNDAANRLATGCESTQEYRQIQGLTKKSQATRDTFTDEMSSVIALFHRTHARLVEKGADPVGTAARIREALAPGLRSVGCYDVAREVRGPAFISKNKRLMDQFRAVERAAKRLNAGPSATVAVL